MKKKITILMVMALVASSCTPNLKSVQNASEIKFEFEGVKVKVPENIDVLLDSSAGMGDYSIYSFTQNDHHVLYVFFGNHPDIDENILENPTKIERVNDMSCKVFYASSNEVVLRADYLVEIPKANREKMLYAHFWYSGLNPEEEQIALEIIHSLERIKGVRPLFCLKSSLLRRKTIPPNKMRRIGWHGFSRSESHVRS